MTTLVLTRTGIETKQRCYLRFKLAFILLCIFGTQCLQAHQGSNAFVEIDTTSNNLTARIELSLLDLELALGLDTNGDASLSWGEIRRQHDHIETLIKRNIVIESDGEPCRAWISQHELSERSGRKYALAIIDSHCASAADLRLDYQLFFDEDPLHRAFVSVVSSDRVDTSPTMLSPLARSMRLTANANTDPAIDNRNGDNTDAIATQSDLANFWAFVQLGMHHIVVGFDHLLFLLTLLIAIGWRHHASSSQHGIQNHPIKEILLVITSFTIAHSITLALGALRIVDLQPSYVELSIAVTIVLAALNTLSRFLTRNIWLIAFVFGLVHGFGFSGMLLEALPSNDRIIASLVGFNIGVEVGQVMIMSLTILIAVVMPLSASQKHRLSSLTLWSTVIVGGYWVVVRATEIDFYLS